MATKMHIRHEKFFKGILCFLCLFVAASFVAPLVPIASASSDTMPCCVDKAAGHCDSGIAPKKIVQPPPEPMCGLDNSQSADDANDPITIVAEPSHKESSSSEPAVELDSVSKPCQMECSACAAGTSRQQRRERSIIEPISHLNPSLSTHSIFENLSFSYSSNEDWEHTSPRGPPARR